MTSGDLTLDLMTDLKIDGSDGSLSVIIFDALSIAAYRMSLRGPGAELEGGVKTTPPVRHGKHRPPARRGLYE